VFGIDRVGKTNARFDREKLLSFNTTWATRLSPDRLLEAFKDFIRVSDSPMRGTDDDLLRKILRTCAGFRTFRQVAEKVRFLFLADDAIDYDPKAVQKVLAKNGGEGYTALSETLPRLRDLSDWTPDAIEKLIHAVCENKAVPIGAIAQPLRVAVTGSTISPSIHDTLALLGRERTAARIERCLKLQGAG
jgi:glutamyl-tRNA synthetase